MEQPVPGIAHNNVSDDKINFSKSHGFLSPEEVELFNKLIFSMIYQNKYTLDRTSIQPNTMGIHRFQKRRMRGEKK